MNFSNYKTKNDHDLFQLTCVLNQQSTLKPTQTQNHFNQWMTLLQQGARLDQPFDTLFVGQTNFQCQFSALDVMMMAWPLEQLGRALSLIGHIPDMSFDHLALISRLAHDQLKSSWGDKTSVTYQINDIIRKNTIFNYGAFNDDISQSVPCWGVIESRIPTHNDAQTIASWIPILNTHIPKVTDISIIKALEEKCRNGGWGLMTEVFARIGVDDALKNKQTYKDLMHIIAEKAPYLSPFNDQETQDFRTEVERQILIAHMPAKKGSLKARKI